MGSYQETERKFLVHTLPPGWKRCRHHRIVQGYLPPRGRDLEIRLRQKAARFFLTFKTGHGGRRGEVEIEIPAASFRALWPLTAQARLAKTRYEIPWQGKTVELDIYHGPHEGLVTAEVEFMSARQCDGFSPPTWLGRELTGNRRYSNALLARQQRLPRSSGQSRG